MTKQIAERETERNACCVCGGTGKHAVTDWWLTREQRKPKTAENTLPLGYCCGAYDCVHFLNENAHTLAGRTPMMFADFFQESVKPRAARASEGKVNAWDAIMGGAK